MRKTLYVLLALLVMSTLILAACGGGEATEEKGGETVPTQYAGLTNPFEGNADAAAAGKTIYDEKCAACHGATGHGDGPAAAALNPKPADLVASSEEYKEDNGFLYWRVAEGGAAEPFLSQGSAMPAWKDKLTQDQIWQVITYFRTLK